MKYYLMPQGKGDLPVFNYADPNRVAATGTADGTAYSVYEGSNVLPLAYVYDSTVSRSAYDALSPVQKQEALLQGVVLQDSVLPQTQLDLESRALPVSVAPGAGASVEGSTVTVTQRNATVTLSFEGVPASETYVYLKGVGFTPLSPSQQVPKQAYDGLPWYSKAKLFKRDMEWSAPREYAITALSPASPVGLRVLNSTKDNHMYGGKTDWLVELGYTDEAQSTATLQFSEPGVYRFSELSAACQPMAKVDAHVDALKATPVNNLTFGTNQITASVDFDSAKALYFSVPYSKGWSASVDGQPVQIQRANTAFMALELGSGHHEVKLTYMTPGLLEGFALTGAGLVALAGVLLAARVRKRAKAAVRAGGASAHSNREGA